MVILIIKKKPINIPPHVSEELSNLLEGLLKIDVLFFFF